MVFKCKAGLAVVQCFLLQHHVEAGFNEILVKMQGMSLGKASIMHPMSRMEKKQFRK